MDSDNLFHKRKERKAASLLRSRARRPREAYLSASLDLGFIIT